MYMYVMQGVSINLFIKTGKKKANELGKIYHYDLYGKREAKYDFLLENRLSTIPYKEIPNKAPMYFMVQKDFDVEEAYNRGLSVNDLFIVSNVGIVTSRDGFVIDEDKETLSTRIKDFFLLPKNELQKKYELKENGSWKIDEVKLKANGFDSKSISKISYRPFDDKYIYYDSNFIERSRKEVMQHLLFQDNLALMTCKQIAIDSWEHIGITKNIADDSRVSNRTKERGYIFPLYVSKDFLGLLQFDNMQKVRIPNLKKELINKIVEVLGVSFVSEKEANKRNFAPIDILDYIYAVLHSPKYRETYKERLS